MEDLISRYLDALLSFVPRDTDDGRSLDDYATLIHVPGRGPEQVYSVKWTNRGPVFTVANYRETVWEFVEKGLDRNPPVDILLSDLDKDHPFFEYVGEECLRSCESYSDGAPGLDYCLMMWRIGEQSGTAECWDPLAREESPWPSTLKAFETLSKQMEAKLESLELAQCID